MYTIDEFWTRRLGGLNNYALPFQVPGWSNSETTSTSFVEAELTLREGFDDLDQPIWFVAAPGAVGKSTLARQIAAATSAVYLNLAEADTVAGNYLAGGLVKTGLYPYWQNEQCTVLIDALDEARLRVTQSSFEDFLDDIVTMTRNRGVPLVIFGRVGVIDDSWLILNEKGVSPPIFEINFFDIERANKFVLSALRRISETPGFEPLRQNLQKHSVVYEDVVRKSLASINKLAASDGSRFSGYAPVLEAVAAVISREKNPAHFSIDGDASSQSELLESLTAKILDRESEKLRAQLGDIPIDTRARLYGPEEQMRRLSHVVLGGPSPSIPNFLTPDEAGVYATALEGFVAQHPYLDGNNRKASGAVFSAAVNAFALFADESQLRIAAERYATDAGHTPNPFLIDFYDAEIGKRKIQEIPPEHVGFIYESARSRASSGDIVRLSIEADKEAEHADMEISAENSATEGKTSGKRYKISQAGMLKFGRQLSGVSIDAEPMSLSIGDGGPAEIHGPTIISVAALNLLCSDLAFSKSDITQTDNSIFIEASELSVSTLNSVPTVRSDVAVGVRWPGSEQFPWTSLSKEEEQIFGELGDKLKLFRRLVMAFRSHSKGELARFKDKIEHARMTGGDFGERLRQRMLDDGILTLRGPMYVLHPDKLGAATGVSFQDIKMRTFGEKARAYLAGI